MIVAAVVVSGLFVVPTNAHDLSKPPDSIAQRTNPLARNDSVIAAGQNVYEKQCASCHGLSGTGDAPAASTFVHQPPDLTKGLHGQTDGELFRKITKETAAEVIIRKINQETLADMIGITPVTGQFLYEYIQYTGLGGQPRRFTRSQIPAQYRSARLVSLFTADLRTRQRMLPSHQLSKTELF